MKCRWDWTAQEIKKIFFFRLLAHLKSRLTRGKNYQLFDGHMEKSIGVWSPENPIPTADMFPMQHRNRQLRTQGVSSVREKMMWAIREENLMTNAKENCTGSCSADTKGLQVLPFTSLALHCVTWEKGTVFLSKMGLKRDVWHQPQGCSKPGLRWSHVKYGLGTLEIMGTILFASIDNISWSTNYFLLISLRGTR